MRLLVLSLLCSAAGACADAAPERAEAQAMIERDPLIAGALHDPLMSDPDLASRNEANAVLGLVDPSGLPVLRASLADARAARDAGRLALLDDGPIPDLPPARGTARGKPLGPQASAPDLLAALGAPARCAGALHEDFALAASLPAVAALPPRAMVVQAAGSDGAACRIRIIRYHTAAASEDVLDYHHARAVRAGLTPMRYAEPEDILAAQNKDQRLVVHVRPAVHGLASVDLLYHAP